MTSLLQAAENVESEVEADVKAAWNTAVADATAFYTQDVKPIMSATLTYIETNGAADLLTIAKRVVAEALTEFESGVPNLGEFLIATAGTVFDEVKAAGISIAAGAEHLATNLALVAIQSPATATSTPSPNPPA